jgi:predicted lipoprotein with Yx(FWY)xxD motif
MTKSKLFAAAPLAAAVLIAGCGSSGGSGGGQAHTSSAPSTPVSAGAAAGKSAGATVELAHTKFGDILVGGHGRALYLFAADKSTSSTCYGACASLWPPLTVTMEPKAGPNVRASLL